jgi:hypothetical protein
MIRTKRYKIVRCGIFKEIGDVWRRKRTKDSGTGDAGGGTIAAGSVIDVEVAGAA